MKYYLDTEFYEKPGSIELISLGMVSEDNRELYFETTESKTLSKQSEWLSNNVFPGLRLQDSECLGVPEQRKAILDFLRKDKNPRFYGYYADYDWVVFCWIFGSMVDLPEHFPKYCIDLKQILDSVEGSFPDSIRPRGFHDALEDARFHKRILDHLLSTPFHIK